MHVQVVLKLFKHVTKSDFFSSSNYVIHPLGTVNFYWSRWLPWMQSWQLFSLTLFLGPGGLRAPAVVADKSKDDHLKTI